MVSPSLAAAIASFNDPRGYLAVASIGLPTRQTVDALTADLTAWFAADRDPQGYDAIIARTRASYARLVKVPAERVAIGSQASVQTSSWRPRLRSVQRYSWRMATSRRSSSPGWSVQE